MIIQTKIKRESSNSRAKHTDNIYGGRKSGSLRVKRLKRTAKRQVRRFIRICVEKRGL